MDNSIYFTFDLKYIQNYDGINSKFHCSNDKYNVKFDDGKI